MSGQNRKIQKIRKVFENFKSVLEIFKALERTEKCM
jgi:hypothetical protein